MHMGEGRGSAVAVAVVGVIVIVSMAAVAEAATYTVGGSGGWTFNVAGWPKGKSFRAGDTLVFNYGVGSHNVVVVDKGGYKGCTTPRGAKIYKSGLDRITLKKGENYFICNYSGHCQSGMKIAVTAS